LGPDNNPDTTKNEKREDANNENRDVAYNEIRDVAYNENRDAANPENRDRANSENRESASYNYRHDVDSRNREAANIKSRYKTEPDVQPEKTASTAKKRSAADDIGAKGCLIIILVFAGIAGIVFFAATYMPRMSFDSLPEIKIFSDSDFRIEWPFGSSGEKQSGGGADTRTRSDSDTGRRQSSSAGDGGGRQSQPAEDGAGQQSQQTGDGVGQGNGGSSASSDNMVAGTSYYAAETDNTIASSNELLSEYAELLIKHEEYTRAVNEYLEGAINRDTFREICETINTFYNEASDRLRYIGNVPETQKYLLMAAVMSDQIAVAAILKVIDGDISAEINNPASNYSRNAGDAKEAYKAFADLMREE